MRAVLILCCLVWQAFGLEDSLYFDAFYLDKDRALAEVPEIFEAIDNAPLAVEKNAIQLSGKYSLRAPAPGTLLRMRLKDLKRLVLDIPGQPGLRVNMTPSSRTLVARQANWPGPELGVIHDTDSGNWIRLYGNVLDIRFQDGELVLAQGDLVLLTAPLAAMPARLALDVECKLHSAHDVACGPIARPELTPLLQTPTPSLATWELVDRYEQGKLTQGPDGIVLSRIEPKHSFNAVAKFATEGGCVLTIPVRAADIGAAVYMRGPQKDELFRLAVGEHNGERVLCQNPISDTDPRKLYEEGWVISEQFWLRAIIGINQVITQYSNDGKRWTEVDYKRFRDGKMAETFSLELHMASGMPGQIRIDQPQIARWHGAMEKLARDLDFSMDDLRHESIVRRADRHFYALMEAAKRGVEIDRILPALHELPWLLTSWSDGQINGEGVWVALGEIYERLGSRLAARGNADRLADLQAAWPARHSIMFRYVRGIRQEPWALSEHRFYDLWHRQKWEELLEEARRLPFSQLAGSESAASHYRHTWDRRLAWWMGQEAQARLANRSSRHPLQISGDREFDNTLGDLLSALETKEFDRAARLLTRSELPDILVPISEDPDRFVRPSLRIRRLIESSPDLREELTKSHVGVGRLRLQQAGLGDNPTQLRELRTHFHGTSVGEAAALRLADRALSLGQFATAAHRYRALVDPPVDKLALLATLPTSGPPAALPAPGPGAFDLELIQGLQLHRPTLEHRHNEYVGLAGYANSATRLVVNHHCLLFALDEGRKLKWQRRRKELKQPLPPPATPVLHGDLVIVPEPLPKEGWSLIACATEDGKLRWQQPIDGDVLGGPLLLNDRLYLAIALDERGRKQVALQAFDPRDGGTLERQVIGGFHSDDRLLRETGMSVWQGQIMLRAGNALFAIDADGPRWLRRFPAIPVDHLRAPDTHYAQAPLIIGDSIVLYALGSGGVHCVDAATGALRWEYVDPAVRNLLALGKERLGVFSERGFTVIRTDSGKPVSYRRETMALHALLPAANGDIIMPWINKVNNEWDASQRRIRWFDPETAEPRAEHLLTGPKQLHDFRGLWSDGRDLYGFIVHRGWVKEDPIRFIRLKRK